MRYGIIKDEDYCEEYFNKPAPCITRIYAHIKEKTSSLRGTDLAEYLLFIPDRGGRPVDYVGQYYHFVWRDEECPKQVYEKAGFSERYAWLKLPVIDIFLHTNRAAVHLLFK
jgi:hypothetical protein